MAHFEFQPLALDGRPTGLCVSCATVAGVILQCPVAMDARQIEHLCEVARTTPDYPVDLCHWIDVKKSVRHTGMKERRMTWNARLYYRNG